MTAAPFGRLLIVGAGLLGTSVALAVKRRWPEVHVSAIDVVAGGHAPFDAHLPAHLPPPACDLAVLACPLSAYGEWLPRLAAADADRPVTDVGSVKRLPEHLARQAGLTAFVGGHPMAGGTIGGPRGASATLFDGKPWFICAGAAPAPAVDLATALAAGCGARPVALDAAGHDATVAATSHLPQIVATLLMLEVGAALDDRALATAGGGLRDTTRLAASAASIWRSIVAANADEIAPLLRGLAQRLQAAADALTDQAATTRLFDEANRARRRIEPPL